MPYYVVLRGESDATVFPGEQEAWVTENRGNEVDDRIWPHGGFIVNSEQEARRCCATRNGWRYEEVRSLDEVPLRGGETVADVKDPPISEEVETEETGPLGSPREQTADENSGSIEGQGVELDTSELTESDAPNTAPAKTYGEMDREELKDVAELIEEEGGPEIDRRESEKTLRQYCETHDHHLESQLVK